MDQVTPPPSSHGCHRRTRSTPERVSPGSSSDETALDSSVAPSTPVSPLQGRGGVTVPSTPLSPPFDGIADVDEDCRDGSVNELKGSPKPAEAAKTIDFEVFPENPDEKPAPCSMMVKQNGKTHFEEDNLVLIAKSRRGQNRRRPHLMPARSDPTGVYSMVGSELPEPSEYTYAQGYDEHTVFSASSRSDSSSHPGPASLFAAARDGINANNAQAKLSPEACLFVASLHMDKSDVELLNALTPEFEKYGTCYIKVKRSNSIPVAFVQYHEKSDADLAMERATGVSFFERPCRIEKAKAPRCVFVSRRDGRAPFLATVVQLLQRCGKIDKTWMLSETDRERYALAPGFCCRYAYYQDSVDAIMYFRNHYVYSVESFLVPEKTQQFTFARASVFSEPNRFSTVPHFDANIHMRNALWVGELPATVTKPEVLRIFANIHRVVSHVDIRTRSTEATSKNASYAVVYFADEQSAYDAALCTHRKLRLTDGGRVPIQWAFKNFVPGLGRDLTGRPITCQDYAYGTRPGNRLNHFAPMLANGPSQASSPSFFTGGVDYRRGPRTLPPPVLNAAFINGVGNAQMGPVMGQQSYLTYQQAFQNFVNNQVYGMFPGSTDTAHVNNIRVANGPASPGVFGGYPVVNGTYATDSRFL